MIAIKSVEFTPVINICYSYSSHLQHVLSLISSAHILGNNYTHQLPCNRAHIYTFVVNVDVAVVGLLAKKITVGLRK